MSAWPAAARAEEPGAVLRAYLQARMQGNLDTARRLWDQRDARRSSAMGIRFADLEASYDDYWLLSAEERATRATTVEMSVRDSVVEENHAYFTVTLDATQPAARDTLRYFLRRTGDAWKVSLPYLHATRGWTRREGRFVRFRARRLVDVSMNGLRAVDVAIENALRQLKAPENALLRLERIKIEYYLCDTEDDVRMLVGTTHREGYLPAGQRIVTRTHANMNATARALVHLALKKTPLHFAPLFEEGMAAALGGNAEMNAAVYVQRARNLAASDEKLLTLPLDSVTLDAKNALPMAAAWCSALIARLEPEELAELLRSTGGTASRVAALDAAAVRESLEKATGQGRRAMRRDVRAHLSQLRVPLVPGCEEWPGEIRDLHSTLSWRHPKDEWALMGYEIGDQYVFTLAPYVAGPPVWLRDKVDSLQAEMMDNQLEWVPPSSGAKIVPEEDPPLVLMLVRAKLEEDVEVYESELFAEHFLTRNYKNEVYGLFVSPDDVRLYDYSQNKLVAEYVAASDPAGEFPFYKEKDYRICFWFPKALISRPLLAYYLAFEEYSGE